MTKIPEWIHENIDDAFPQNVCLVATVSDDGMPSIGPKGNVLVYDDETLAYWERAMRGAWDNLKSNPRVTIFFRNPALRESGLLPAAVPRAFGARRRSTKTGQHARPFGTKWFNQKRIETRTRKALQSSSK